jgi:hypothetical protein
MAQGNPDVFPAGIEKISARNSGGCSYTKFHGE